MNKRLLRGQATLLFLFMIFPLIVATFWGNQMLLTRYATLHLAHAKAKDINWRLLEKSTDFYRAKQQCLQTKRADHQPYRINFSEKRGVEELNFGSFCYYTPLIVNAPKKNLLIRQWTTYINEKLLSKLTITPSSQPLILNAASPFRIYYLADKENTLNIDGTIHAIVLARGNLHIHGKGTLRGMVITAGDIIGLQHNRYGDWVENSEHCQGRITMRCIEKVRIVYDKDVQKLLEDVGLWQWREGSWYDFNYTNS